MEFTSSRSVQGLASPTSDRSGSPGLRALGRLGLLARGVVYGVIGILALKLALGLGGKTESQTGALKTIANQEFGRVLLIALAVGLAAYAIWRLIDGFTNSGPESSAMKRIAAIASGLAYAALAYIAVKIIVGAHASGSGPRHATAGVLGWPAGPEIVFAAGVGLIAGGIYQTYKGAAQKFLEDSKTQRMSETTRRAFTGVGVAGYVARGVTFALIGYGLIKAAVDYSAKSASGLDGALEKLAHAPAGPLLLGAVAAGFIGFALYSIADARYHRL
jgi:hypothetical protein